MNSMLSQIKKKRSDNQAQKKEYQQKLKDGTEKRKNEKTQAELLNQFGLTADGVKDAKESWIQILGKPKIKGIVLQGLTYEANGDLVPSFLEWVKKNNVAALGVLSVALDKKVAGMIQRPGTYQGGKGYSFPYSPVLFITKQNGSAGMKPYTPQGNNALVELVIGALCANMGMSCPWIADKISYKAIDQLARSEKITFQRVLNTISYNTMPITEKGEMAIPDTTKKVLLLAAENPVNIILYDAYTKFTAKSSDFNVAKTEYKKEKNIAYLMCKLETNKVTKYLEDSQNGKVEVVRLQGPVIHQPAKDTAETYIKKKKERDAELD